MVLNKLSFSRIIIVYIIFVCTLPWASAEVFTAITDCEPLLDTYKHVIDELDALIGEEENRLLAIKKQIDEYRKEHAIAIEDVPNYIGNPIFAFTLIKRLTTDLNDIKKRIHTGSGSKKNTSLIDEGAKYPTEEDLSGAVVALTRLQATYKLKARDLAEGIINGNVCSFPISAGDCFEMGRVLYTNGDYKNSITWMMEALRKYEEEKNDAYSFTEVDVMDYISWAYNMLGDVRTAHKWTKKLLAVNQGHTRGQTNLLNFEKTIAEEEAAGLVKPATNVLEDSNNDNMYETLCRGELELPADITKRLKCFYLTKNHPFLRLAPIKTEQHYTNPDAFVFYDVISDKEIEYIKALAKSKIQRAEVHDRVTGKPIVYEHRICKSAFLEDDDVISRISQRITDFTGLSMNTAEQLQVANYGIGGHYIPHYDQPRNVGTIYSKSKYGNRIATVLFYMSQVAQGGATVFTELGLSVFPVKNAALFWMNLHPSGELNLATLHAGCPVLLGSKWVSNKWIRLAGQEFLRPCSLEFQGEETMRQFPRPVPKTSR